MYKLNLYVLTSILTKISKAMKESSEKLTELDQIIRWWDGKTNNNIWMPSYFLYIEIKLWLVEIMVWTMKESDKKLTEFDRIIRQCNGKTNSNIWMPSIFLIY